MVLLEDIIGSVKKVNESIGLDYPMLEGVEYYQADNVTNAYRNAA